MRPLRFFHSVVVFAVVAVNGSRLLAQTDSSIPLQYKPPPINSTLNTYEQILRIKQQKLAIEEQERAAERERVMRREHAERPVAKEKNTEPAGQTPQGLAPLLTYGSFNGRGWNAFSPDAKVVYIWAAGDALSRENPTAGAKYVAGTLTFTETAIAIDRFYSEPENLLVNVIDALRFVAMKANGAPQAEVASAISFNRMLANKSPETGRPGAASTTSSSPSNEDSISARIPGEFHGWIGYTTFKLDNDQIWQQVPPGNKSCYLLNPKVFIYSSGAGYRMKVDGVDETIVVKRLQ